MQAWRCSVFERSRKLLARHPPVMLPVGLSPPFCAPLRLIPALGRHPSPSKSKTGWVAATSIVRGGASSSRGKSLPRATGTREKASRPAASVRFGITPRNLSTRGNRRVTTGRAERRATRQSPCNVSATALQRAVGTIAREYHPSTHIQEERHARCAVRFARLFFVACRHRPRPGADGLGDHARRDFRRRPHV